MQVPHASAAFCMQYRPRKLAYMRPILHTKAFLRTHLHLDCRRWLRDSATAGSGISHDSLGKPLHGRLNPCLIVTEFCINLRNLSGPVEKYRFFLYRYPLFTPYPGIKDTRTDIQTLSKDRLLSSGHYLHRKRQPKYSCRQNRSRPAIPQNQVRFSTESDGSGYRSRQELHIW